MMDILEKYKNRIIIIGFVVFCVIAMYLKWGYDKKNYNNGICLNCGGHYEYEMTLSSKGGSGNVIYKCDKCGHVIEVSNYME